MRRSPHAARSATTLAAQPAAAISDSLGVPVTAAAPVAIGHAVVPIVVAPPPPSPPPPTTPPPSLPPPQSPPSPPPAMLPPSQQQPSQELPSDQTPVAVASPSPPMSAIEGSSDTQAQTAGDEVSAGTPTFVLIIVGVVGLLVGFLLTAILRRRRMAKASVVLTATGARNVPESVAAVSAKDDDRAADVPEAFVGEDVEATPMTADRMDEFI